MARLRRHTIALWRDRPNPLFAHNARDTFLAAANALVSKLPMHTRAPVGPPPARVDRPNAGGQDQVGLHSLRERLRTPLVEPGPRHLEHPTHRGDVKDPLVRTDEHESHRASLAKKAVAFFSISRSS